MDYWEIEMRKALVIIILFIVNYGLYSIGFNRYELEQVKTIFKV